MDLINEGKVPAGWTLGFERDGRELLVIAIKATFVIPENGEQALLAEAQSKLVEADQFTGEPGFSAPLYETDYAHRKPLCDVVVNGSAYATGRKPLTRVCIGVKIGSMAKAFAVVGDRVWEGSIVGVRAGKPAPFISMPISYDYAFGGVSDSKGAPNKAATYLQNPVGLGYSPETRNLSGKPMPNTEEISDPVAKSNGHYRPMSLGFLGRNWQPRAGFAGTYDEKWLDDRAPFWPDDFDYRYFQATPPDQQISYPRGGESVVLRNLTPDGYVEFKLPTLSSSVLFIPRHGRARDINAVVDTILIEPDLGTFDITWRIAYPLRKSCFDLRRVVVSKNAKEWYGKQRFGGKPHYKNLAELVKARKG